MTAGATTTDGSRPAGGAIVLVATPIGNLGDLSPRAVDALRTADLICCEDTRRTRALLTHAGITGKKLLSVHARNEEHRIPSLLAAAAAGATVVVVSDAGTPAISDPGAKVVAAAVAAGVAVSTVPGPSAAVAALVVSGLPTARFCFEGFLARRGGDRRRRLEAIAVEERTTVLYEAPSRVAATLADLAAACGPQRAVVVARELTKLHEELWRGTLDEAATAFVDRAVKGEVVLVVAGSAAAAAPVDDAAVVGALRRAVEGGASWRDAAAAVAADLGVARREVYDRALALRRDHEREDGSGGGGG